MTARYSFDEWLAGGPCACWWDGVLLIHGRHCCFESDVHCHPVPEGLGPPCKCAQCQQTTTATTAQQLGLFAEAVPRG